MEEIELIEETGYREQQRQRRDLYGRGSGAVCCFLLVILLVAAMSAAGVILSVMSFLRDLRFAANLVDAGSNRTMSSAGNGSIEEEPDYSEYKPGPYNPEEVWLIQFDYGGSNLEYFDPISGQIKGFNVDVINAVCRKANKNCRIVVDSYSRCWSEGGGSDGLMSRWYHACAGWRVTSERLLTYKFSAPFQKNIPAYFVTSSGSSSQFNWRDLSGKKIGFWDAWFTDALCLKRQGVPLNDDQIVVYPTSEALESALINGEIDASFIGADVDFVSRQNIASDAIQCLLEGAGMMMRKDTFLEKWWNPAWKAVLASGEYSEICDDLLTVHGDKPGLSKQLLCGDNKKKSILLANFMG